MTFAKTRPQPLVSPEVVLNLWAYTDEAGCILRLAGRAYVLCGTEEEKLTALHRLAGSDFLGAPWHPAPENFTIVDENGTQLRRVAHASLLNDPYGHSTLFGPLMDKLEQGVPEQARSVNGEYRKFQLRLPQDPLCVTTVVMEREDGSLVPMISAR
jgi:hypothetical protein